MNNIDYELEILGEKKTYTPREEFIQPIVNSKKKIFEITSDNSYGKTFILNLIAYALEADKLDNDRILKSIKESISRYDDKTSYNLDYKIDLDLPDNKKLSLSRANGRGKIIQIDEGAPIGYNVLHKDLTVIYDVPSNPSERLNAVIKDLGAWNENLKVKFEKIARYFNEVSKEFDSVRNEGKIENYKLKSVNFGNQILEKTISIESNKKLLVNLNKISNLEKLSLLFQKNLVLDEKIHKKTKEFKSLKKPSKIEKKDKIKIKELNIELAKTEKNFKEIISELIYKINLDIEINDLIIDDITNANHYEIIKNTEIRDVFLSDDYVRLQTQFIDSINYITDTILRFILDKKNDKAYVIHNSYKQFVNLLEELVENEIDYFLKDATSVDSNKLKKALETIISNHKVKDYDSLKRFLKNDLNPLKGLLVYFMRTYNQLLKENKKKLINDDDSKYFKIYAELKELKDYSKKVKNNLELTRASCAHALKINDLNHFDSIEKISDLKYNIKKIISDQRLLESLNISINKIEKDIKDLEKSQNGLVLEQRMIDRSLKIEDAKNSSKYNDFEKNKIKTFIKMFYIINGNLKAYKDLISNIENGNLSKFKANEDIRFIELAGKIIAYSMDNKLLRADGEFVELKFYDMIEQEFHCKGDLVIKKADVSTGLASANYLKQRIENVEGKYVVVLLDEIGNMAQGAINKVIESIKKLENQNRLVLAVLTRPKSNGIKIIEY